MPLYASVRTWRPTAAGRASVSVVSCLSFSVTVRATRAPSKRAFAIVMSCVLNTICVVGRRTSSAMLSVPRSVFAAASGVSAMRVVERHDGLGQAPGRGVEVERRYVRAGRRGGTQDERGRKSEPRESIQHPAAFRTNTELPYRYAGTSTCMNDDRTNQDPEDVALEDADPPTDGGKGDEYDEGVVAADDTGMLGGEQLITQMEIERGLRGGD